MIKAICIIGVTALVITGVLVYLVIRGGSDESDKN